MGAAYPGCSRRAPAQREQRLDGWPRLARRLLRQPLVQAAWGRLLRKQLRIRRLQRLWHGIGLVLQGVPKSLRARFSSGLPKQ